MYRVLQGANAPFAAKVVVFVKHTMITYIEVQCCTVDDTIYTVKYCKKISKPMTICGCISLE